MNPKRKTAQIDRLAAAIGYIATDFERFGGLFLDALLEIPMNHQGTNLLGYPVAGVVDSISDDGRVAAEYSADEDYFSGAMLKAESDLKKALSRKPLARDIWLVSGQRKRPQIAQAFETRIRALPSMAGKTLHLWGADDIANHIVEELIFSDAVVRRLAHYLPDLQRIRDEEAASRLAPMPDRRRLIRAEVDRELSRRLQSQSCVSISGMGGLGKSAAAAAFAEEHEDDYDLVIWLDPTEVRRLEDLQALSLVRGGESRNVAALLRTRACLLVIDDADPRLQTDALAGLCGPKSHIVLTQRTVSPGSYELPFLSRIETEEILNLAGEACPPEVIEVIWSTVGGHPLTLGLMSSSVRQGASWAEIAIDCRAVGEFEDHGQPLADRLLGRLRHTLERELSVIAWAEQPSCGEGFLEEVIHPLGIRKLRESGLTSADRSGIVRLHDVVYPMHSRILVVTLTLGVPNSRRTTQA